MRTAAALALLALLPDARMAAAPTDPVVVQVPVVLDVRGIGTSHYTSDLTVLSLATTESAVELTFVPSPGLQAYPPLRTDEVLTNGVRFYTADVVDYLRRRGVPLPNDGTPVVGTLFVRLPKQTAADPAPFIGTRISTPNASTQVGGTFGTYTLGVPVGSGLGTFTSIFGLRENGSYRTNMAFVHGGGSNASQPISLQLLFFDGATGKVAGEPIAVTLQPGEWKQLSSVLSRVGIPQGWVRISETNGSDPYIAYAVVNDGPAGACGGPCGTSDGSWIDGRATEGVLPIVLSLRDYRTELVLANNLSTDEVVSFAYTAADALTKNTFGTRFAHITMPARTQIIEPDALAFLRGLGVPIPDDGSSQGGSLRVGGAVALARVYSKNPDAAVGGTFGLAFPAVPAAGQAKTEAWVYGLRQDVASRSNLALVNTATTGDMSSVFDVTIYDALRGFGRAPIARSLKPGQWYQWNAILAMYGLHEGFARVRCTSSASAPCLFATYGVVNDGATPADGTSDGSYIPMVNVK